MRSRYSVPSSKCVFCYITKDLQKAIKKHQEELQKKENADKGRKAHTVTFTYASRSFANSKSGRKKWF